MKTLLFFIFFGLIGSSTYGQSNRSQKRDSAAFWTKLGTIDSEMGKYKIAITEFTKAIAFDPTFLMAFALRSQAKMNIEDYKGAKEDATETIRLDPVRFEFYFCRGSIEVYLEEMYEAKKDADRALELNPKYGAAYLLKGIIKSLTGDIKGGCEFFYRAKQLGRTDASIYIKQYCK